MGKFNLGDMIAAGKVPNLGTNPTAEVIEYFPLDQLEEDENNFYSMDGIDELAANIQLIGLQQPLRVRRKGGESEKPVIVSGHRRFAALRILAEEDPERWGKAPCIVEVGGNQSPALQELRLIYANSDTRHMTSADLSKQVERVEMLLYQLKKEGYEFPGRMRDHVAEACKVSKSKLSRLKVIREKLIGEWRPRYEGGKLDESPAYALAKLPDADQLTIFAHKGACTLLTAGEVERYGGKLAAVDQLVCKRDDGACSNIAQKREQVMKCYPSSSTTVCAKCCSKCPDLVDCKHACPKQADKVKKLNAEARERRKQEKVALEDLERPTIEKIRKLYERFGAARAAAGKSLDACWSIVGVHSSYFGGNDAVSAREQGGGKVQTNTILPYGYHAYLSTVERFVGIADLFGCSLDYLLCRTDDPKGLCGGSAEPPDEEPGEEEQDG